MHAGGPWEQGLSEVQSVLVENGAEVLHFRKHFQMICWSELGASKLAR